MNRKLVVMLSGLVFVLVAAALYLSPLAQAEETSGPSHARKGDIGKERKSMFNGMSPMFGQIVEAMMEATLKVLEKPETTQRLATFNKNYYDALLAKDFTEEQALKIVMSVGIPTMSMAK